MFHIGLQQLERSAGLPKADIRLTAEVHQTMRTKISDLGLDPRDTTGRELYSTLGSRLKKDESQFLLALLKGVKISNITPDPTSHVAALLNRELKNTPVFALKNISARKLLKSNIPKKVMKQLGYRSAESMLKHESVSSLFAAASLIESDLWTKKILAAYTKLKITDFETRPLSIDNPDSERWQKLSEKVVASKRHNILTFKELGSVVLLPLPLASDVHSRPALPALTTAILTLHAVNEVLVASTYLKLHQASLDFGNIIKETVLREPVLEDQLLDRPVSWSLLQQYYARLNATGAQIRTDLFEPFVAAQDLVWHGVENVLARIEPSLEFWKGTAHLGHMHDGKAVSFNLTDNILSHCNRLPFQNRMSNYFRNQLTAELLLRYMDQDRLERSLTHSNQRQFTGATQALTVS